MKKTIALVALMLLASRGLALAGSHPHGPFPKHKSSGHVFAVHHNPHKPGPGSFHTAGAHHGNNRG